MTNHTPFPTVFLKIFDNKFSDNKFFDTYFSIHICFTQPPRNRPQSKHRFLSPLPRNRSRHTDLLGTRANTLSLASSIFIASSLFPHHHRQSSKLARSSPSVDQPRLIRRVGWLHHIFKDSGVVCVVGSHRCLFLSGWHRAGWSSRRSSPLEDTMFGISAQR